MSFLKDTNSIDKVASTTQVKNYSQAAGLDFVSGKLYVDLDSNGAQLFNDAVNDTAKHVGAKNGATVTVSEKGFGGILHQTTFTLTDLPLTLADATVGAGVKIYDFPEGAILIQGAVGSVTEKTTSVLASTLNTGVTYNWGVGSTTQASGTLATTEQDFIPTTNGTASATINVAGAASNGVRTAAPAVFNGTSAAKAAYFNVGVATATDIDGDATTVWNGTITLTWLYLGDV